MVTASPLQDLWQVIDEKIVDDLVTRKGANEIVAALIADKPSAADRAHELAGLAILGKLALMRDKSDDFHRWAERHGLRRLANTLVELNRVIALPTRGKAILQAQALTRFLEHAAAEDVETLKAMVIAGR